MAVEVVKPISSVNDMFRFLLAEFYLCLKVVGLLIEVQVE